MIRSSKHILKYNTKHKNSVLDQIFTDYKQDLQYYIDLILKGELPLKKFLSTKDLPTNILKHSGWKSIIYKQASEIVRSQIKSANDRRYKKYKQLYVKCKEKNKCKWFTNKKYSELSLKYVVYTKYFTKPSLENVSITLDQNLVDFQPGDHFDEFVRVKSPYLHTPKKRSFAITINLPIKHHKHSLKYQVWDRKKSVQLSVINGNYYITLFYEKEQSEPRLTGETIGIDQGYKKLLACSTGEILGQELESIYTKISNKVRGSKAYKRLLVHKKNLINYYVNRLDLTNAREIVLEKLKQVKYKTKQKKSIQTKFMNKLQYWSYRQVTTKLERWCQENGALLTLINPAYTSQTCSSCGCVDKTSRKKETYDCQHCGYISDADVNAAINISRMGLYRVHSPVS